MYVINLFLSFIIVKILKNSVNENPSRGLKTAKTHELLGGSAPWTPARGPKVGPWTPPLKASRKGARDARFACI
jgi:hypothetical protein